MTEVGESSLTDRERGSICRSLLIDYRSALLAEDLDTKGISEVDVAGSLAAAESHIRS
jgi:hypothetical protein